VLHTILLSIVVNNAPNDYIKLAAIGIIVFVNASFCIWIVGGIIDEKLQEKKLLIKKYKKK